MESILEVLVYILDWRGKRKAKKEGREYRITIGQYVMIYGMCLVAIICLSALIYKAYFK